MSQVDSQVSLVGCVRVCEEEGEKGRADWACGVCV